jgi:hypothetical protein
MSQELVAGTVPAFLPRFPHLRGPARPDFPEKSSEGEKITWPYAQNSDFYGDFSRHALCHSTRRVAGLIKNTAGP